MKNLLLYFSLSFLLLFGCKQTDSNAQTQDKSRQDRTERNDNAPSQDENGITPKWGSRFYKAHNGKIEALEHIWLRHNYNSTYNNVSRFAKEYSTRQDIKKLVTDALKKASKSDIQQDATGKTVTVTMDKLTGLSQKNRPTYKIRIFLDDKNYVKTAYPL